MTDRTLEADNETKSFKKTRLPGKLFDFCLCHVSRAFDNGQRKRVKSRTQKANYRSVYIFNHLQIIKVTDRTIQTK